MSHPITNALHARATAYARTVEETTTLLAGCTPCELAAQQRAQVSETYDATAGRIPWEGVLTIEGLATGDGRMIENNALIWEQLPAALRVAPTDVGAHGGAVWIGTIETMERQANGRIWGTGFVDLGVEEAAELVRRMQANGNRAGVSVDLDSVAFEIRVARDLLQREEDISEEGPAEATEDEPVDEEGRVTVLEIDTDDELMVTTSARVRGATVVDIPAFIDAYISLVTDQAATTDTPLSLVAAGIPVDPPGAWFANPGLREPTRLTITPEGRVYGHVAVWGTCHRGHTTNGQCVTPPYSANGYREFMTGTTLTAEGDLIATGVLTMSTSHAGLNLTAAAARYHYENTGSAVADLAAGEDSHGIWVAGALRPGVTRQQQRELRAAPLSGDWRAFGRDSELVAILAVNMPGFPIPAPAGMVASGVMTALVAAGTLPLDAPRDTLTDDDMDLLRELAAAERQRRQEARATEAAALAALIAPPDPHAVEAAAMARSLEASALAAAVRR